MVQLYAENNLSGIPVFQLEFFFFFGFRVYFRNLVPTYLIVCRLNTTSFQNVEVSHS